MSSTIAGIAIVAFILSTTQAAVALTRWWREPTFRVLQARLATVGEAEKRFANGGTLTILALGGARTRTIVNWRALIGIEPKKGQPSSAAGTNRLVEAISQVVPEHGAVKFDLDLEGGIFVGDAERLRVVLIFDFGRYEEPVDFGMTRDAAGSYSLAGHPFDLPMGSVWGGLSRWYRFRNAVRKRFA